MQVGTGDLCAVQGRGWAVAVTAVLKPAANTAPQASAKPGRSLSCLMLTARSSNEREKAQGVPSWTHVPAMAESGFEPQGLEELCVPETAQPSLDVSLPARCCPGRLWEGLQPFLSELEASKAARPELRAAPSSDLNT